MHRVMTATIAALTLAACNQNSVSLTNASPEEVARAVKESGGGVTLRPGQWETTVEVTEAEMPGVPKAVGDAIRSRQERFQKHSYCVTPEEAAHPGGGLFTGEKSSKCTIEKFAMTGGRIDQTVSCPGPDGRPGMTMVTSGTYTAESMTGTASMDMGAIGMKMKANIASRRVGACAGGDAAK